MRIACLFCNRGLLDNVTFKLRPKEQGGGRQIELWGEGGKVE